MTVRYEYKCDKCGKNYVEQRGAQEPQFFSDCATGDGGNYELVNETVLAEELEVVAAAPTPVEEVTETVE